MYDKKIVEQAIAIHTQTYGTKPTAVAYAPGRIEVQENHYPVRRCNPYKIKSDD